MEFYVLLILALAVARMTVLTVDDKLAEPFRAWMIKRFGTDSLLTYMVHCSNCSSFWWGLVASPLVCDVLDLPWTWAPIAALALSQASMISYRWMDK